MLDNFETALEKEEYKTGYARRSFREGAHWARGYLSKFERTRLLNDELKKVRKYIRNLQKAKPQPTEHMTGAITAFEMVEANLLKALRNQPKAGAPLSEDKERDEKGEK